MARPAPEIFICADEQSLHRAAAELVAAAAAASVADRGRFFWVLSGGRTPLPAYRLLAEEPLRAEMPWDKVYCFWSDERAVPPLHPDSNYGQARAALLDKVPVPAHQIIRVKGELPPIEAADDYKDALTDLASENRLWPRFDLVLLGLGADGHTASLFPGPARAADFRHPVLAVSGAPANPPVGRVTLTPLALNSAHHVLFVVGGAEKAAAVAGTLGQGEDEERWPGRWIQPVAGRLTWLLDDAAASGLPPAMPTSRWTGAESIAALVASP
jgi:6-phosphogluconolactonase